VREIDLGLDFAGFGTAGARGPARGLRFAGGAEVGPQFDRFMLLEGTGMSLFFCDSNLWKYVKNRFALDFQLPCQIVNSNLAHPLFRSSGLSR
jgi:hypothetical protein